MVPSQFLYPVPIFLLVYLFPFCPLLLPPRCVSPVFDAAWYVQSSSVLVSWCFAKVVVFYAYLLQYFFICNPWYSEYFSVTFHFKCCYSFFVLFTYGPCFTSIYCNQSTNQSNLYSANIPGKARLSGMTTASVFNSKIKDPAPKHQRAIGHAGVYEGRGKAKSKRCVLRCFLNVATEMAELKDSRRLFQRAQGWKALAVLVLTLGTDRLIPLFDHSEWGWEWCGKLGVKRNRLFFMQGYM